MMPPPMRTPRKSERPKSIKELPAFLANMIKGFFSRLFYIVSLVWSAKKSLLIILAGFCILEGFYPVISALISAELLNQVGHAANGTLSSFKYILTPLIAYFAFLFFTQMMQKLSTMTVRIAGELVSNHIRLRIIQKASSLDVGSFDRPEFYEKLENANREAGFRPINILTSTFTIISSFISVVSFIVILATLHPVAPVLIILMALPAAVINYVYRHKTFLYMRRHSKERRQMEYYASMVTNKDMVKEMRLMDLSNTFTDKFKSTFKRYFKGIKRLIYHENFWQIGTSLATTLTNVALFLFVAYKVYQGELQLGDYSLYTGALNSIISSVGSLVTMTATVYEGTLFIDNMKTFMNEKQTVVPLQNPALQPSRGKHVIEFQNVSFAYPGSNKFGLKNVNLRLERGQTTVLVGLNGAGKTTLIKLLTRLYDPTEGVILLDGKDIRLYDTKALYDLFGIIFQDFGKYAATVSENISFGDVHKEVDDTAVQQAAKDSSAAEFIQRLPNGYQTPLTRYFEFNGIEPSIGQWQKLSVARAFYKNSDILILDEPTASLDPLAEQEIFNQFAKLGENKITVFVSHRLSSATTAQQILVLNYGEIIERGTHEELMQLHDKYYELFSTQAKRYTGENMQ